MWVTCSSPSSRTSPRVIVVLPAAESPTTPRMIGRGICSSSPRLEVAVLVGEDRAGEDVRGLDGDQVAALERMATVVEAAGLAHPRALDGVADAAPVREARAPDAALDVFAEGFARVGRELVALLVEHEVGDRDQLAHVEVGEVDVVRDARAHARVGGKEGLHAIAVARQDDDEVVALGLHDLQQDLDRLLAVVALVLGAVEVVGLVDEEHAAAGALEHLPGLRGRVADVLPDEVVARDGHDLGLRDVAQPMEDLGHAQRDGRLPRAGVAGEAHVQRGSRAGQALLAAQAIDDEQRRDLADARLHRLAARRGRHRAARARPRCRRATGASANSTLTRRVRRCPSPCPMRRSGCPAGASVA